MNNRLDDFGVLFRQYWKFSDEINKKMRHIYEEELGRKVELPIDIEEVAKKLGFYISSEIFPCNKIYGFLEKKTISVSSKISYKEKRWVIAQAIGIRQLDKSNSIHVIQNPLLVKQNIDTIISDAVALLILLPIPLFKEELSEYISDLETSKYELDIMEYFQTLSDRSQIPIIPLSFGYHLITQMLCFQRQQAFKDCGYDINKSVQEDKYENIFY